MKSVSSQRLKFRLAAIFLGLCFAMVLGAYYYYQNVIRHEFWVFSMVALGILLVTAVVVWYNHLRQRNFYRELLEKRSALYQAREEFGATLYSIGDGVITTDRHGRVRHLNPAAEKLTGWTEGEARGRNVKEVFHIVNEDTREEAEIPVEKVIRDGEVVGLANHTVLIAKNGTETPIADSSAPIRDSKGNLLGVIMVFSDQTEERLRHRLLSIRLKLFEYAVDHSLQEIMTKMLDETGELLQSPVGFIHFIMPDQEVLWLQAWSTRTRLKFYREDNLGLYHNISEAGVLADAIRRKETVIFNDYPSLLDKKVLPGIQGNITRLMVAPVVRNNAVTAIVGIGNKPDQYTGEEAEILHFLADVAWEIAEHKLNEIRLQQSEERFYHLFERAPLGYQSLDENGHFIEIKQAKARLEEQKRELSSMVANLPGFIYRCKYDKEWTMLYLSGGCKTVTGYMPDDFILNRKLTFNDIIKEEYQPSIYRKWENAIAQKSFFNCEYEIVTADKEVKWVSELGCRGL